jgi:hypothetical protein
MAPVPQRGTKKPVEVIFSFLFQNTNTYWSELQMTGEVFKRQELFFHNSEVSKL